MGLALVTAAAETPITLTEAKAHLRVDGSDEDTYITALLSAATAYLDGKDGILNRALVTQTWDLTLDGFPADSDAIALPLPPLQSITYIKYYDTDGVLQTLDSGNYVLDTAEEPGEVYLAYNQSWPSTRDIRNAVTIRFIAGYGDGEDVPPPLHHAIKLMLAHWYKNREAVSEKMFKAVPMAAKACFAPFSAKGFGG